MSKIAILGGGISGLSAAYYLSRLKNANIAKIVVVESSNRFGGWMQSTQFKEGSVFEHGPRSVRGAGKAGINTVQLVEDLGLEKDVLPIMKSHPATKNRFIYANNQLCPLPNRLAALFARQAPFTKPFALVGCKDIFTRSTPMHDESIHDFFTRRFGKEMADYAADPLIRGIFAGDCRKLSMKSCLPDVFKAEQTHGSVIRGMMKTPKDLTPYTGLVQRMKTEKWAIWALRGGLGRLPEAMVSELKKDDRVHVVPNSSCQKLELSDNKAQISYGGKDESFDFVFSSILAKSLSPLLRNSHPTLADQLSLIPAVSVAVVYLEYDSCSLPVQGFGHLVPSIEPSKVLGVIYESCLFEEHGKNNGKGIRLTCMMGGAWFKEHFGDPNNCDMDNIKNIALESVKDHLNITQDPSRVVVKLQKDCIPQYQVGHQDILDNLGSYITEKNLPLALIGCSYRGVSVNDCIYNAKLEVEKISRQLA